MKRSGRTARRRRDRWGTRAEEPLHQGVNDDTSDRYQQHGGPWSPMEREKRGAFDNTRQPTSLRYSARAPVPPARRRLRADKFEMFRPLVGELWTVFQKSKKLGSLKCMKGGLY